MLVSLCRICSKSPIISMFTQVKTLSDGNRARFLATSAYQQWKAQPQTPTSARP